MPLIDNEYKIDGVKACDAWVMSHRLPSACDGPPFISTRGKVS